MTADLFGDVSTVDTGARSDGDFYETPRWMTLSLLHHHPEIRGASVLEPCSGRNAITNVLREYGCTVLTNDIDARHPAERHDDAAADRFWLDTPDVDWVITNPPFGVAIDVLIRAHEHAKAGVAMLLRKTFLEPTADRGPWLNLYPPTSAIGLPRHSFRGQGSDSCATDWYLWETKPARALPPIVIDYFAKTRRVA